VRLEQDDLAETNGQYHFDFDLTPDSNLPMRIVPGPRSAHDWFTQGLEQAQIGLLPEAAGSFRQALLDGGPNIDTVPAFFLRARGRAIERDMA